MFWSTFADLPDVKITPNQDFLLGYDRYEEGVEYEMSMELGSFCVNVGWADTDDDVDPTITQAPADELKVDNSEIGQEG